jgi:restriction system protein
VTGRTHDGGVDGHGVVPILNLRVCFQAKRWTGSVSGDSVRSLIGTVVNNGYDRGLFIATSAFTAAAKEEAEKPSSRLVLIDGNTLVDLMIKKRLGVKDVVVQAEIDEEFFNRLGQ